MLRIAAVKALSRSLTHIEHAGFLTSADIICALANSTSGTEVPQPVVQQQLPAGCPELIQKVRPFGSFSLQAVRCYSQCDCPTLGGPQPDVVIVEYDEDEVDRFIALADAIEAAFPNLIVEGNPEGSGRAGSFEVTNAASGHLLFSKLSGGGWPDPDAVVEALAAASGACDLPSAQRQQ